jgi:hypothetical protein
MYVKHNPYVRISNQITRNRALCSVLTRASQACNSALASVEYYEHPKTAQWNETIIVR